MPSSPIFECHCFASHGSNSWAQFVCRLYRAEDPPRLPCSCVLADASRQGETFQSGLTREEEKRTASNGRLFSLRIASVSRSLGPPLVQREPLSECKVVHRSNCSQFWTTEPSCTQRALDQTVKQSEASTTETASPRVQREGHTHCVALPAVPLSTEGRRGASPG